MLTTGRDSKPEPAHDRAHPSRILRLGRKRPDRRPAWCSVARCCSAMQPSIVRCSRRLCTATARTPCARCPRRAGRRACRRRARAAGRGRRAPRGRSARRRRRERERRLRHGQPLLEPRLVDVQALLDVHEPAAHLDRGVAGRREQVHLVALLHPLARGTPRPARSRARRSATPNVGRSSSRDRLPSLAASASASRAATSAAVGTLNPM